MPCTRVEGCSGPTAARPPVNHMEDTAAASVSVAAAASAPIDEHAACAHRFHYAQGLPLSDTIYTRVHRCDVLEMPYVWTEHLRQDAPPAALRAVALLSAASLCLLHWA